MPTYSELVGRHGSQAAACRATGIAPSTFSENYQKEIKGKQSPAIQSIMNGAGLTGPPGICWLRTVDDQGNKVTVTLKPENEEAQDIRDIIRGSVAEAYADKRPKFTPRKAPAKGDYLLVVDLADVHFLKLSVRTETGYEYNREFARHRVIEGTKALLAMAKLHGVGRILFVLGNDILHVDNAHNTTTGGTAQDTDGTIFQGYSAAKGALIEAIKLCAKVADVDLIHCMSNHDWVMGWALSQDIASYFREHPNVNSTDYNMSEAHRKYYRYGSNLVMVTHGDGAKEEALSSLFLLEAKDHVGECANKYVLLHHFHHKIAKKRGIQNILAEKDLIGMTAIHTDTATPKFEGHGIQVEHVRSPSPPDSWHDRKAFVNRQAVECFMYLPEDGQKIRFTECF